MISFEYIVSVLDTRFCTFFFIPKTKNRFSFERQTRFKVFPKDDDDVFFIDRYHRSVAGSNATRRILKETTTRVYRTAGMMRLTDVKDDQP